MRVVSLNEEPVNDTYTIEINSSDTSNPTTITVLTNNASSNYNVTVDDVYYSIAESNANKIVSFTYSDVWSASNQTFVINHTSSSLPIPSNRFVVGLLTRCYSDGSTEYIGREKQYGDVGSNLNVQVIR